MAAGQADCKCRSSHQPEREPIAFEKTGDKIMQKKIPIKKKNPLKKELKSFIDRVHTGKRPVVSGIEGRRALAVALEIIKKITPAKQ